MFLRLQTKHEESQFVGYIKPKDIGISRLFVFRLSDWLVVYAGYRIGH